jgi:hypothetical protein
MIRGQQTTDKRPLVGRGRCFEIDGFSEALRPAWDALCGMLDELEQDTFDDSLAGLSAVTDLAAVVPDAHIARIGQTLASVLSDDAGKIRIPREHYLDSPDLVLRDAILTLTSEWPVALCLDRLELADAATLGALTDLLDILWEHDQPFYFLLVLTCEPEVGRSRRVLDRIEEILERYDRPKNRIITRVRLKSGEDPADEEPSGALETGLLDPVLLDPVLLDRIELDWSSLDRPSRQMLAAASVQGSRFSPATLASVCGFDELEVISFLSELSAEGVVQRASGPAIFELFGRGVFEFKDPTLADALMAATSLEERQLIHGRIADYLLEQRATLREDRARLSKSASDGAISDRFNCDGAKLDASLDALAHMIVRHLHAAGRSIEAARALRDVEASLDGAALDKPVARGKFARGERTRQSTWLARIAEETLLSLVRLQPHADPSDIAHASYDAACVAAERRLALGDEKKARQLFERAIDHARWLDDDDLECRILHHVTEPTKEIL